MITYQTLFEHFPVPAFLLGPLAEVLLANRAAALLLGLPVSGAEEGEVAAEGPATLHVGERWVSLVEQIRDALDGRRTALDLLDPRDPDSDARIPLLCTPLPDGQGGRLLLCVAASEVFASRGWMALEEGHLHRIRIGEDPARTLQNILVVIRHAYDLDRALFIQRDHPAPGQATVSHETTRPGLEPLGGEVPHFANDFYPLSWKPLLRPVALPDLAAMTLPPGMRALLDRLGVRSLLAVEVRPAEGPSGFLIGVQHEPRHWSVEETKLFGHLGWGASLALAASARLGVAVERTRWYQSLVESALLANPASLQEGAAEMARTLLRLSGGRAALVLRRLAMAPEGVEVLARAGGVRLVDESAACRMLAAKMVEQRGTTPWSTDLPAPLQAGGADGRSLALTHAVAVPCALAGESEPMLGQLWSLHDGPVPLERDQLAALRVLGSLLAGGLDEDRRREEEERFSVPLSGEASAAALAHDFNNILGIISAYASSAESDLEPGSPLREDLRVVLDAAEQGGRLLRQLAQPVDAARPAPPPAPLDVVRALRQIRDLLRRLFGASLELELATPGDLPLIGLSEAALKQPVLDLCLALQELSPPGGPGRIAIRTGTVRLDERTAPLLHPEARADNYLYVEVVAGGVRLREETRTLLRAAGELSPASPGESTPSFAVPGSESAQRTLLAAREIVRQAGGFCTVGERPSGGASVLRLHYRLSGVEEQRIPSEELPVLGIGGEQAAAPTVLLIDDEAALRSSGERNLARYGYQVLTAPDGEVGIRLYQRFRGRIDLVILDLIMPGLDGRNTFRALRAIDPEVRVIFASGFATIQTLAELEQEGALGFIPKPYTAKEINRAVRAVLRGA